MSAIKAAVHFTEEIHGEGRQEEGDQSPPWAGVYGESKYGEGLCSMFQPGGL